MCFFGSFLVGKKKHKQNPPQNPGQSREHFVYVLFCFMPWKLKPGFINRVLVAVVFEASKCL